MPLCPILQKGEDDYFGCVINERVYIDLWIKNNIRTRNIYLIFNGLKLKFKI